MHCKKCGAELLDWAKVCVICGTPTDNAEGGFEDLSTEPEIDSARSNADAVTQDLHILDDSEEAFVSSNKVFPDDFQDIPMDGSARHVDYLDSTGATKKVFPDDFKQSTMESERLEVERIMGEDFSGSGDVTYSDAMESTRQVQDFPSLDTFDQDAQFGTVYVDDGIEDDETDGRGAGGRQGKKSPVGAIVAVACAAAAIAACAFVVVPSFTSVSKVDQSSSIVQKKADSTSSVKQATEKSAAVTNKVQVVLPVVAEGLNENGSRIPVHVSGTDANKTSVDVNGFVDQTGAGLELLPGTYEARIVASPISENGVLYRVPDGVLTVTVNADGKVVVAPEGGNLTLTALAAGDVTEENLEIARTWIEKDPQRSQLANTLVERAHARISEANAAQQKANAQQQERNSTTNNTSSTTNNNTGNTTNNNATTNNNNYNYNYNNNNDYSQDDDYSYTPSDNTNNDSNYNNTDTSSGTTEPTNPGSDSGTTEPTNPGSDSGTGEPTGSGSGAGGEGDYGA